MFPSSSRSLKGGQTPIASCLGPLILDWLWGKNNSSALRKESPVKTKKNKKIPRPMQYLFITDLLITSRFRLSLPAGADSLQALV
jgi:hypothetical protein